MSSKSVSSCAYLLICFMLATARYAQSSAQVDGRGLLLNHRPVALTDVSETSRKVGSRSLRANSRIIDARPKPSGWFGDFSQDESTYNAEGLNAYPDDPTFAVKYGRDPSLKSPFQPSEILGAEFFHESRSDGAAHAWQTHFPSVSGSIAGNREADNPWRYTPSGWVQDYVPVTDSSIELEGSGGTRHANWFDSSVNQIDGFGRPMTPTIVNGQWYATSWVERSVNTTIKCKKPGCKAASSLLMYDVASEEAHLCSVSIHVHPTDYDDDWSREHVEYWKINGKVAKRECNPRARGCNTTAQRPLYSCLNQFNVDDLIDKNGSLVIEGKNSPFVDECPVNGEDLLSAVAVGTCLVRNKTQPAQENTTASLFTMNDTHGETILKCDSPGCTDEQKLYFSPAIALNGGTCTLSVNVTQTDFDDNVGVPEEIEFLSVHGQNMTLNSPQPGRNPCNDVYKGKNVTAAEKIYEAVTKYDVTKLVQQVHPQGVLKIKGKISTAVDECAFEKNLLYAKVVMDCIPPKNFAAQPPPSSHVLLHTPRQQ